MPAVASPVPVEPRPAGREARSEARASAAIPVTIRAGDARRATSRDLSASGMYVILNDQVELNHRLPLQLYQRVRLEFALGERKFSLEAAPVRLEQRGVAFQFVGPSDEEQAAIRAHIEATAAVPPLTPA